MTQRNGLFRNTPSSELAIQKYVEVAQSIGISSAQLALKWCDNVDGVTSTIIGATSLNQLKENIAAFDMTLDEQTQQQINDVLNLYPAPF